MHVIEMTVKVVLVAKGVFSEPALPDAAGLLANAGIGAALFRAAGREVGAGEPGFEKPQADGEVGIPMRQRYEQVQVIGQQDDRVDFKRMK